MVRRTGPVSIRTAAPKSRRLDLAGCAVAGDVARTDVTSPILFKPLAIDAQAGGAESRLGNRMEISATRERA